MLTTGENAHDTIFRSLRDIGADRSRLSPEDAAQQLLPDYSALGLNYRLTDLQAALGSSQLAKFDAMLARRHECARRYFELINGSSLARWLRPPSLPRGREHAYQAYVCRLIPPDDDEQTLKRWYVRRNRLMQGLHNAGIATRPGTHAPHMLGYYRNKYKIRAADYPQSWRADWLTLGLPLHPKMEPDEQALVCRQIESLWGAAKM
jgi:dTDP-4-amino-4,6-dideoxygalactose transaminase